MLHAIVIETIIYDGNNLRMNFISRYQKQGLFSISNRWTFFEQNLSTSNSNRLNKFYLQQKTVISCVVLHMNHPSSTTLSEEAEGKK